MAVLVPVNRDQLKYMSSTHHAAISAGFSRTGQVMTCRFQVLRLCLVLLGVAPFRSAPLGVLRPKPRWGRLGPRFGGFFFFRSL
jgi:hypothetical protein